MWSGTPWDGTNAVYANRSIDRGTNWLATDIRLDGGSSANAFGLSMTVDRRTDPPVPAVYVAGTTLETARRTSSNCSLDAGFSWDAEPTRIDNDAAQERNSFYALNAMDDRVLVAWHDDGTWASTSISVFGRRRQPWPPRPAWTPRRGSAHSSTKLTRGRPRGIRVDGLPDARRGWRLRTAGHLLPALGR